MLGVYRSQMLQACQLPPHAVWALLVSWYSLWAAFWKTVPKRLYFPVSLTQCVARPVITTVIRHHQPADCPAPKHLLLSAEPQPTLSPTLWCFRTQATPSSGGWASPQSSPRKSQVVSLV